MHPWGSISHYLSVSLWGPHTHGMYSLVSRVCLNEHARERGHDSRTLKVQTLNGNCEQFRKGDCCVACNH